MTAVSPEFLDTNVVVYAFSQDPHNERALDLLSTGCTISVHVLNEFVNVARRKLGMNWSEIDEALVSVRAVCPNVLPVDIETHSLAVRLAARHGFAFFDALMVAAALQGGCETLWSEDMQDGSIIDGRLRISNSFRERQG
jgi:predicted nucleic acid-binding protein